MRFNLFDLKKKLERQKEAEISWAEIARRADVHPNTLVNISQNKTRRVDLETLEKLLAFFYAEGLEVEVGDLFTTREEATP